MQLAGFDQMAQSGAVSWPGDAPAQGVAFESADPELIALGMGDGPRVALDDLLAGWATISPTLTADQLRPALVADLAASAASSDPTRRFWAQYIVQLGRIAESPYDLLDPAVPGDALLDPAQVAFLGYRFQAELWLAGQRAAGLLPALSPRLAALPAGARPCTMTETQQTVLDAVALGTSTFMGGVIDLALEDVPGAEKVSRATAAAGAALMVAKFLWTLAAFDAHITAAPSPLFREPDGTSHAQTALTATFKFDTGNWQVMNCVRPALNALGLDFNLPQDGAIAGARLDWEAYAVWERYQKTAILRYAPGEAPLRRTTDESGKDTIHVEGNPRSTPLTGALRQDFRMARYQAKVALKDTKLWQDIQDAIGAAIPLKGGDPISAAFSLLTETLMRMNSVVFAAGYALPVRDWRAGDAVVHVAMAGERSGAAAPDGSGSEVAQTAAVLNMEEDPDAPPLTFVMMAGSPTAGVAYLLENGWRLLAYQGARQWIEGCLCVAGEERLSWDRQYRASTVTDAEPVVVAVDVQPDGSFTLDLPLGGTHGPSRSRSSDEGCGFPLEYADARGTVSQDLGKVTITGTLDLGQPTGAIEGTFSQQLPLPVPGAEGFFAGGVASHDIDATVVVDYRLAYTLQVFSLPPGVSPPPGGRAVAAPARPAVPAFTSWAGVADTARLACRAVGP
jgi:hypothetical protein